MPTELGRPLVGSHRICENEHMVAPTGSENRESNWQTRLGISREQLREFCGRWGLAELSLFGSVVKEGFGPDSDVDVLIRLDDSKPHRAWDWIDMTDELQGMFGRKVDLVSADRLENPFFRKAVLAEREVVYAG